MVVFMPFIYITPEYAICNNLSAKLLIICGNCKAMPQNYQHLFLRLLKTFC